MTKNNLAEMNEAALTIQAMRCKEEVAEEMEKLKPKKPVFNSNELAKQKMAMELIKQGLSEEAVCRILNISAELLS